MKHQNKSLWQLLRIIPVIVLVFCRISTVSAQTAPEIAEKALAATVYLEMQDSKGVPLGFGSGFFVGDNLIATNYHVIEGAARGSSKTGGSIQHLHDRRCHSNGQDERPRAPKSHDVRYQASTSRQ